MMYEKTIWPSCCRCYIGSFNPGITDSRLAPFFKGVLPITRVKNEVSLNMKTICFKTHRILGMLLILYLNIPLAIGETLEQAWDVAIAVDRSLEAVRSQSRAAEQTLSAAEGTRWPNFGLNAAYTQLDDVPELDLSQTGLPLTLSAADDNFYAAQAQLSIPLYTSGRISRGIDAASAGLKAARSQVRGSTQNIKLSVAEAFVTVLRAEHAVVVAQTNIASLSAHALDVERFHKKGLVPKNDLLAANVALADAQQKGITANNALDIARASYNRRLGHPLQTPVVLEEVMPELSPEIVENNVKNLTELALSQRTELIQLFEQAQALRHRAAGKRAEGNPQIALSGAYTYLENQIFADDDVLSASIGLKWSLFDAGVIKNRAGALSYQADALMQKRDDVTSIIALQVRKAWLDGNETRKRLDVTQEAVGQAEENLKVAKSLKRMRLSSHSQNVKEWRIFK